MKKLVLGFFTSHLSYLAYFWYIIIPKTQVNPKSKTTFLSMLLLLGLIAALVPEIDFNYKSLHVVQKVHGGFL
jgi:hypothetical protein